MLIKLSSSALKQTRWYEYGVRFLLGGGATVFAGLVGARLGTSTGGLFLALPAIFCASATLIESHARRTKENAGFSGRRRGQQAAALDAAGAGLGSIGLAAFAVTFYALVSMSVIGAFAAAILVWTTISVSAWWLRRTLRITSRRIRPARGERSAKDRGLFTEHQEAIHLGSGLKLIEPGKNGVPLLAIRQAGKLVLKPQPLRIETLFECEWLKSSSHLPSSVAAGRGCWPSVRPVR